MQNDTPIIRKPSPLVGVWRNALLQSFFNDPVTLVSGLFLLVVVLAAVFAPWVSPHGDRDQQVPLRHLSPVSTGMASR